MSPLSPWDVQFLDDPDNWDLSGPSFDLILCLPHSANEDEVKQAFLADGRVFPWDPATRRSMGGTGRLNVLDECNQLPYVLSSPHQFPTAVGVGFSYISRKESPRSEFLVYVQSGHLEHACGTSCLNSDDLGDPKLLVAFYELLISLTRSVDKRVSVHSVMIHGEAWVWPKAKDWRGLILVHRDVARVTRWPAARVEDDWVGIPLCPAQG